MVFALENLTEYLAYFTEIITWVGTSFVAILNVLLDSALIIAVGIGLGMMFIAYAWRFLKNIRA